MLVTGDLLVLLLLLCWSGYSTAPTRCPALGSCGHPGLTKPDWSWVGLVTMILLIVAMLTVIEFVRVNNRKITRAIMQDDDVVQLIGAVGFKVGSECPSRTDILQ